MRRERLLFTGLLLAGLGALIAFYLYTRPMPEPEGTADATAATEIVDQPGPYLVIEVTGEANGTIRIDLNEVAAPNHTERMVALAESGAYDNVVFHRVIEGFMAQSGDVEYGKSDGDVSWAGRGGSDQPDLGAEFSTLSFERGVVGMARSQSVDSANSQFFIMFAPAPHLNGQYTVVGKVTEGMDVVDAIKRGSGQGGAVASAPDVMTKVAVQQ